jgi:hypothetical protein
LEIKIENREVCFTSEKLSFGENIETFCMVGANRVRGAVCACRAEEIQFPRLVRRLVTWDLILGGRVLWTRLEKGGKNRKDEGSNWRRGNCKG